jgi:hypothetical protein
MGCGGSVLLFRDVAAVINAVGQRLLQLPDVPEDRLYKERLKPLGCLATAVKHVLQGNYLPFGILHLYGDGSLNTLLATTFQLFVRCSQQADLLAYIKVAQQLFYWLDHVTKDFTGTFIATKLPVEVSYGALIGTFRLQNAVYGPR